MPHDWFFFVRVLFGKNKQQQQQQQPQQKQQRQTQKSLDWNTILKFWIFEAVSRSYSKKAEVHGRMLYQVHVGRLQF